MKNIPQEYFCFDKSKQVAQQGSIIPAMIIIVLILTLGGGTYVYLESKKVAKIETNNKEIEITATSTITKENLVATSSPEINTDINSTSTVVKGGIKTVTKSATSTTSTFIGNDGSKSSITIDTIDKEDEEYIKKNTTYSCGNENCFIENFKNCINTTLTSDVGFMGKVFYEIKPKTQNVCTLTFKYLRHPNPEFTGKEMTCEVNNKLSFEDSSMEMYSNATLEGNPSSCSGSFYEEIKYR